MRTFVFQEEQTSGFKEQVRDRIQSELERVAATCRDMATLLRQLGVSVEGGPFATTQQAMLYSVLPFSQLGYAFRKFHKSSVKG